MLMIIFAAIPCFYFTTALDEGVDRDSTALSVVSYITRIWQPYRPSGGRSCRAAG